MLAFTEQPASSPISFAGMPLYQGGCIVASVTQNAHLAEFVLAAATLAFTSSARRFSRVAFSSCIKNPRR